jgi:SAM-dependent methyltransferase
MRDHHHHRRLRVTLSRSKSDGAREDQNQKSFVVVVVAIMSSRAFASSRHQSLCVLRRPMQHLSNAKKKKKKKSTAKRKVVEASSKSSSKFSPFQTKLGAIAYDSGYRQLFRLLGYPGCEKEAEELVTILAPERDEDGKRILSSLLDVSCGPGIVTKSIVESKRFAKVVALDYFESMCERARETLERDCDNCNYEVLQGDVSALQFADATFEKVSSTAGMHCWPSPVKGMKEIKRVVKPSDKNDRNDWSVLFSTVVLPNKGDETKETYSWETNKPFLDREAVLDIVRESGFDEYEVVREDRAYILVKARYFR